MLRVAITHFEFTWYRLNFPKADSFREVDYSRRMASTGSRRAARMAG
jgi:hypothetical protein